VETIKRQTRATYMDVCLQAKIRGCGLELLPGLFIRSVCIAQLHCSGSMWLVMLYICYAFCVCFSAIWV